MRRYFVDARHVLLCQNLNCSLLRSAVMVVSTEESQKRNQSFNDEPFMASPSSQQEDSFDDIPQDMMPEPILTAPFIDGLYGKLVEGGIGYFFPSAKFDLLEPEPDAGEHRVTRTSRGTSLIVNWLGSRYALTRGEPFSESELKLLTSIAAVLDSRYRTIVDATRVEQRFELFRGLPEDRYVSAYIDGAPYAQKVWKGPDRVEDAIEVLRTSSLSTCENRRISTGVLLFGKGRSAMSAGPPRMLCATLQLELNRASIDSG